MDGNSKKRRLTIEPGGTRFATLLARHEIAATAQASAHGPLVTVLRNGLARHDFDFQIFSGSNHLLAIYFQPSGAQLC